MVPVGASFQKFFKRRSEIDMLDMEYHDKARFNQLSSVITEFPAKQITITHSRPTSITPTVSCPSRLGMTGVSQHTSKRQVMLAARELYENQQDIKSTTPARGLKPDKGQVRRFPHPGIGMLHNTFQDLEDMMADEMSEKVCSIRV